ncbi:PstA family ABC transporter permease [Persicirhabdus sediminis]|uniref:ABC transporter permease subunit n=1 Tax=Persicirhabdus sediminis TaxID=454144 RepID=A0A8J7MIX0_9BACT|nr:ABC transporter permease subunit [Persicirhabdus sediminis]MBK1791818.1 ABC transporter permease subunit [Persicirhabdus sediminis]
MSSLPDKKDAIATSLNPFKQGKSRLRTIERIQRSVLLIATYSILISALVVFGTIIKNGAPVLWDKGFSFLTEKPQTLTVLDVAATEGLEISADGFERIVGDNKKLPVENSEEFEKSYPHTRFDLQPGTIIGDGYLQLIENNNHDFRVGFLSRSRDAQVGFNLSADSEFRVTSEQLEEIKKVDPEIVAGELTPVSEETNYFRVRVEKGDYEINKATYDALNPTTLIYIMLQSFNDDERNQIRSTKIPNSQVVTLSQAQYAACLAEEGGLPFSKVEPQVSVQDFLQFSMPAGQYELASKVLDILKLANPNASFVSLHNTERGAVELDLKEAVTLSLPTAAFEQVVRDNPDFKISNVSNYEVKKPFVRFDLSKDAQILAPNEVQLELKGENAGSGALNILDEHSHSYSGGGILGPIIGTALLVIICMTVALITGIASAIYLNEYARKGRFLKTVRLAMLNLAGVPSIVFGLFGLGLFVLIAPQITDTPSSSNNVVLRVPLAKIASEPNLRDIENNSIFMAESHHKTSDVVAAASANGKARFYNGWTYLSFQGWGTCMLAGGFTLAIMVLPVIITACEESLQAVPMGFREASLALGASKWQSIRTAVLPYAFPGILTASVLGITRVAGETAPIMFTAAVAERSLLPWEGLQSHGFGAFLEFLQQSVQAMPYHIYTVAGRIPQSQYTEPMQYGSVLVFLMLVMSLAGVSVYLRIRIRNKIKW